MESKVDCQTERHQQGREESQVLACLLPLHLRAHCMFMTAGLQLDEVGVLVIVAILTFSVRV